MKKILIPTDFSNNAQNAFRYALLFNEQLGADIELINVVPPDYQLVDTPIVVTPVSEVWIKTAQKNAKKFIRETLTHLQTSHQLKELPAVKDHIEIGLPISIILDMAMEKNVDLIVLGTQGEHSRIDRFLGTVSAGLVKKARVPVLVVPENVPFKSIEKVTIAIDLKESDAWEIFKATNLIGSSLKEVNLVHITPSGKAPKTEIRMEDLQEYFTKINPPYKVNFDTLSYDNLNAALNKYVIKQESDVLVMLGPHQSGFQKLFFQSNTAKMTYQTKVPFLRMN